MIQIFITDMSIKDKISSKEPHNITVISFNDNKSTINQIKKTPDGPIEIYDYTHNNEHGENQILLVSDHINQTGDNPLIGNQHKTTEQFVDISDLYKTKGGAITHCLGKNFNTHKHKHQYPSTYLCYISIIAKAIGRKNIKAFLINTTQDTPND